MLINFLANNRDDLIARCAVKVAARPTRKASRAQLHTGVPMFLDQLIRTLEAESAGDASASVTISRLLEDDRPQMGVTAAAHGKALLALDYTVDQVVHDYGDLCQAVTDLAFDRDAPFSIDEYRMLDRCLDNAIADAVTEFSAQRDSAIHLRQASEGNLRLGCLMHELRNALNSAALAAEAMRVGNLTANGATWAVLRRSHVAMAKLIDRSLAEVKSESGQANPREVVALGELLREAHEAGKLAADARGLRFVLEPVEPGLAVEARRDLLSGALDNLIGNALKFTRPHTTVVLQAHALAGRAMIEVKDHCGGLRHGDAERIFTPFSQRGDDKTGVGLGLSIARESVQADGGTLTVENFPEHGCVFTIDLPLRPLRAVNPPTTALSELRPPAPT
jgi:signal transduction histidine kinase